jgi:hypothetical protein
MNETECGRGRVVDSPGLHTDAHPAQPPDARAELARIGAMLAERDAAVQAVGALLDAIGWRSRRDVSRIAAWLCDRERTARLAGMEQAARIVESAVMDPHNRDEAAMAIRRAAGETKEGQ